tara:strand:+ start:14614 stop:16119 length:1506 start_codon:yes stop_codon:yes gene_type:complete
MSRNKIIKNISDLKKIRKIYKNRKLSLCHGVFDLIHPGHLNHFNEAKSLSDILVISITSDNFVKKGFNKPYFNQQQRLEFLCSLEMIDYVVIAESKSAIPIIKNLEPNFYFKGPDYRKESGDIAGNLKNELKELKKIKGKFLITSGATLSSTKLMNTNFPDFNPVKKEIKNQIGSEVEKKKFLNQYILTKKKLSNKKILILGEIIIDEYCYCEPLGKPSKENIISVNYRNKKEFYGGIIPILNIVSQFSKNVTALSVYNKKKIDFPNEIKKKMNLEFIKDAKFVDVKKTRFIHEKSFNKIFEYYNFDEKYPSNNKFKNFLKKKIKSFDIVIVADFGHGLIDNEVVKILERAKKLCVNVQTNSGNRGFNLFTKFDKAFYLCIDEPEIRLGMSNNVDSLEKLILNKQNSKFENITITRGIEGQAFKKNKKIYKFPAINKKVVDTIGAGDTLFAYSSCFLSVSANIVLSNLVGTVAGALKTEIVGHENFVDEKKVFKYLYSLLK